MANNSKSVVWITGASSGIGEACACLYAQRGASLILTSSSAEHLAPVAEKCRDLGAEVCVLPYDFRNLNEVDALVQKAWSIFGRVDVMYCNAGVSQRTNIADTSMETIRKIMEINYFAPVAMVKSALPLMLESGGCHVAVTTSIAGHFGFPLRCAYSSSKFALIGFFETLSAEYSKNGIKVTMVCPGRVKTKISLNALGINGEKHQKMDPGQEGGMAPEKAASIIVSAIDNGKREVLVGGRELIMVYVKRFFPALCARISRKIKPM